MKRWRKADPYLSSLLLLDRDDSTKASDFHGSFIPEVPRSFMERLTEPGDWIWDCMAGSGTTARAAARMEDRNVFMTDLNPTSHEIVEADARSVVIAEMCSSARKPKVGYAASTPFLFDLVIFHPPYHNIIQFSETPGDLSGYSSVVKFLDSFAHVITNVCYHLKTGGFVGLVVGDIWRTGSAEWVPLAFDCIRAAQGIRPRLSLRAIQVKDIKGNRQDHRRNLRRARCFNAGTVEFCHEYMITFKLTK